MPLGTTIICSNLWRAENAVALSNQYLNRNLFAYEPNVRYILGSALWHPNPPVARQSGANGGTITFHSKLKNCNQMRHPATSPSNHLPPQSTFPPPMRTSNLTKRTQL